MPDVAILFPPLGTDGGSDLQAAIGTLAVGMRGEVNTVDRSSSGINTCIACNGQKEEADLIVRSFLLHGSVVVARFSDFREAGNPPSNHPASPVSIGGYTRTGG